MKKITVKMVVDRAQALIDAINNNTTSLWVHTLEHTEDCVILNETEIAESEDEDAEVFQFKGIEREVSSLEQVLQIFCMEKFARRCDITGKGMNEGYCFDEGGAYAIDEASALKIANDYGYTSLEDAYNDDVYYWTEWCIEHDEQDWFYDADGNEYQYDKDGIPFLVKVKQ